MATLQGLEIRQSSAALRGTHTGIRNNPQVAKYIDTTICIGCKACEVACKQWNQLPSTNGGVNTLSGDSYDNTRQLDGIHWRHVKFIEQFSESRTDGRWLLMSDVCKHCVHAGCLEDPVQ